MGKNKKEIFRADIFYRANGHSLILSYLHRGTKTNRHVQVAQRQRVVQLSTLAYSLFLALQKVVYQCTYPGCRIAAVKSIRAIEAHVRKEHLGRAENHPDDGEEEFYYTEVEIPNVLPRTRAYTEPASQMANLSLADHLDMARPAHEDPEITRAVSGFRSKMRSLSGTQPSMTATGNKSGSLLINQFQGSPASLTTPITIAPSVVKRIYIFFRNPDFEFSHAFSRALRVNTS